MAKLVKFVALDSQAVYVNSETVRAVVPKAGNAFIIFGDTGISGVDVQGSPASVAQQLFG